MGGSFSPWNLIPVVGGLLGSLFGTKRSGKPTEYTAMQDPQGAAMRKFLYNQIYQNFNKPAGGYGPSNDMMNMLSGIFQGRR